MSIVAAVQMHATNNVCENLAKAEQWIAKAAAQGAKLVVLPEMFCFSGTFLEEKLKIQEKAGVGTIQDFLANTARRYGIWIVGGTIPLSSDEPDRIYAASLVFDDQGRPVARYDKIHLFDVSVGDKQYRESKATKPGVQAVVVDTPVGKLGLSVCYDIRFPELFRWMFNQGAEIFTIPSAFTYKTGMAHWEVMLRCRAVENFSYVIGAGQNSPDKELYGHSMIVSPWGEILDRLEDQEGLVVATIDRQTLRTIRSQMPVHEHQRIFSTCSRTIG